MQKGFYPIPQSAEFDLLHIITILNKKNTLSSRLKCTKNMDKQPMFLKAETKLKIVNSFLGIV